MSRLLILGATGSLGRHVFRQALGAGHDHLTPTCWFAGTMGVVLAMLEPDAGLSTRGSSGGSALKPPRARVVRISSKDIIVRPPPTRFRTDCRQ
jgi:hypothetical protein